MIADWRHRGLYMQHRHGVDPAAADEALADPDRVVIAPDPASISGRTVRTIGWSPSAGMLITVITLSDDGVLHGVNGWPANRRDARLYRGDSR